MTTVSPTQLLDALVRGDPLALDRLQARLVAAADAEELIDVAYRELDSPIGRLLVAATPFGLVRLAFDGENRDEVLGGLATHVSPRVLEAPRRLDGVARELDEYFARRRTAFEVPVDLRLAHGFRYEVLVELCRVAYGQTRSYAALAVAAGRPKAVRAVGSACATNPVPLVVPCHRVVRSDGSIGNYGGGSDVKRYLIDLESAPFGEAASRDPQSPGASSR